MRNHFRSMHEFYLKENQIYSQIIALFALAAGLSVDCIRQNHPEYLPKLMEGIADVIEDELVAWINENGGWVSDPIQIDYKKKKWKKLLFSLFIQQLGLVTHVSPKQNQCSYVEWTVLIIGCAFSLFVLYFLLRLIGYHLVPFLIIWDKLRDRSLQSFLTHCKKLTENNVCLPNEFRKRKIKTVNR